MRYIACIFILFALPITSKAQLRTASGKKMTVEMCLEKAQEAELKGDYRSASEYLNNAAFIHWDRKELKEAIKHYHTSLIYNKKVNNQSGIYGICSNLATIYADLKRYDSSFVYFKKTLVGRKRQGVPEPIISAHINLAVVLNNLKRRQEAAQHLKDALALAKESLDLSQMRSCYGMLAETYEKAGDSENMKRYFDLYRNTHEMLQKRKISSVKAKAEQAHLRAQLAESEKKKAELEIALKNSEIINKDKTIQTQDSAIHGLESNYSKKELAYKVLEQRKEIQKAIFATKHAQDRQKIATQRLYVGAITSILLLALIGIFLSYINQQAKKKANTLLREKNQKINAQKLQIVEQNHNLESILEDLEDKNIQVTASIRYAKRIQEAILPSFYKIRRALPDSFVYFKPRNIVSGDFYFFYQFEETQKVVLAAVDCTGHGVPGAFMCMIGNENLNRIVHSNGIDSPAQILDELSLGVNRTLQKDVTQIHDGMDVALVVIDRDAKKMRFAGAKNPLIYIQDGDLKTIRGDRTSIGDVYKKNMQFQEHSVDVSVPTTFYLFSDGYQDQFGGTRGHKFMIKNLRQLFLEIHKYPMEEQKERLAQNFKDWQGSLPMIDDVLVIGAKI